MNALTVGRKSLAVASLLSFFANFAVAQLITPQRSRAEEPTRANALLIGAAEVQGVSTPDYSARTREPSSRNSTTSATSDLRLVSTARDTNSHSILSPVSSSISGAPSRFLSWSPASIGASDTTLAEYEGAETALPNSSTLLTFR